MSNRGRNRATQLVKVEVSVDVTTHTLLPSAHEHAQRDSANETIVTVTDKFWSAVNCPIKVGIEPISWLLLRYLSISHTRTHTPLSSAHKHEQRDSANREFESSLTIP